MESLNFEQFKADIHRTLISKLDLEKLSRVNSARRGRRWPAWSRRSSAASSVPLSATEKEKIQSDLLDEVFGLGPLEPLLRDPTISDILVNDKNHVFIERRGISEKIDTRSATTGI